MRCPARGCHFCPLSSCNGMGGGFFFRGCMVNKNQNIMDPNSCLNKADGFEPVFVLLGRDIAATSAVEAWIGARIIYGLDEPGSPKLMSALQWIDDAIAWRKNGK